MNADEPWSDDERRALALKANEAAVVVGEEIDSLITKYDAVECLTLAINLAYMVWKELMSDDTSLKEFIEKVALSLRTVHEGHEQQREQ